MSCLPFAAVEGNKVEGNPVSPVLQLVRESDVDAVEPNASFGVFDGV